MADLPIPFSAPMVRAILREIEKPGTGKTQTRRLVKPQGGSTCWQERAPSGDHVWKTDVRHAFGPATMLDLYDIGDRLWVREEHFQFGHWEIDPGKLTKGGRDKWRFVADRPEVVFVPPAEYRNGRHAKDPATPAWHKRLGRFIFRKHSRMTLYVTDVRVERLQDISEADAIAEGLELIPREQRGQQLLFRVPGVDVPVGASPPHLYGRLWNFINGPGAWQENPWVVAYTFVPRLGNIDSLPANLQEAA